MLKGSCACGSVRYEIRGELIGTVTYCHCWRFAVVSGEELLSSWESSPGTRRFFAGCCGSPIFKKDDALPQVLGFRLGTLDSDPSRVAEMHFMVGSKAPWVEIRDSLPREAGGVPFGERD
jgi:hypothetical protein